MFIWIALAGLILLALAAYSVGRRKVLAAVGGQTRALHSLPGYYGAFLALWVAAPAAILLLLAEAARDRHPVSFAYTDAQHRRTERAVQPFGVVAHAGLAVDLGALRWRLHRRFGRNDGEGFGDRRWWRCRSRAARRAPTARRCDAPGRS